MSKNYFNEKTIKNDYKYIFLCGSKYQNKEYDKRNVLSDFFKSISCDYCPIILEKEFDFPRKRSKKLAYGDIYMRNLYQVEMLTTYLSDAIIIIHESISTGAEAGLFLSNREASEKLFLVVPDSEAVEEDKIGSFLKLAFFRGKSREKIITYYPKIKSYKPSNDIQSIHTYFYDNLIKGNLKKQFLQIVSNNDIQIVFTKNIKKIQNNTIYYGINENDEKIIIKLLPRTLVSCMAISFNLMECNKCIFSNRFRKLKDIIGDIERILCDIYVTTIREKDPAFFSLCGSVSSCQIIPQLKVRDVGPEAIIGMGLYFFQAAGFIEIEKSSEYDEDETVVISRKMVIDETGKKDFFYRRYKDCLSEVIPKRI